MISTDPEKVMLEEGYTPKEIENIRNLGKDFPAFCPDCGKLWVRDYPFPVRRCPSCGKVKPWVEEE